MINNMDGWKSTDRKKLRQGESQKREEVRREKMQVREKVGKSPITVFFQIRMVEK